MGNPDLHGRVAIITGSTSGIGKGTAVVFAKSGCSLVLTGRRAEKLEETKADCIQAGLSADKILLVPGDLTDQKHRRDLVEKAVAKFGQLDTLVNNAGTNVLKDPLEQTLEDLDAILDLNVRALADLTQIALPHLIKSKGSVVNVSSTFSDMAVPICMYYCMTKAAVDSFTKCLAYHLGPKGVRVNAVNPGPVRTELGDKASGGQGGDLFDMLEAEQPCGRTGTTEEIGRMIAFLASPDSGFITGAIHVIDGGMQLTSTIAPKLAAMS